MADDPNLVLKVYGVIDVSAMAAVPTEDQWRALIQQARTKTTVAAILAYLRASQNDFYAAKRARGTSLMKLSLFTFEVDQDDKAALLATLNTIAAGYSVTGTTLQKLQGCLQVECRAAAVDLGYTTTQANKLTVTIINNPGVFDRMGAISAVQAYLVTNDAAWHGAG